MFKQKQAKSEKHTHQIKMCTIPEPMTAGRVVVVLVVVSVVLVVVDKVLVVVDVVLVVVFCTIPENKPNYVNRMNSIINSILK
jgi:hypothetical protein